MKRSEVSKLLTLAAAYDRRTAGEADVEAWFLLLANTDFEDARLAVLAHYADEHRWLMPADIVKRVRRIRTDRAAAIVGPGQPAEVPDANPDNEAAYRRALREQRHRAGSGQLVEGTARRLNELESKQLEEWAEGTATAKSVDTALAATTLTCFNPYAVPCPHCDAEARKPCTAKGTSDRLADPHPSRVDNARALT